MFIAGRAAAPAQGGRDRFGDPLPGHSPAEFERFRVGLDDFLEVETAEEGLGPAFNARELRRLPQRAGDRRRRAWCPRCAPPTGTSRAGFTR